MLKKKQREQEEIDAKIKVLKRAAQNADRTNFTSMLWKSAPEVSRYLKGYRLTGMDISYTEEYVNDALPRFFHTMDFIPLNGRNRILELGANPYLFSILLMKLFDHKLEFANFFDENIYETKISSLTQEMTNDYFDETIKFNSNIFNLERTNPYPYKQNSFDMVLCCEVLEHLVLSPFEVFNQVYKILKPGGRLILTLPNAVRLSNLGSMLIGQNIFDKFHKVVHGRHNREYTLEEIRTLATKYGYEIEKLETRDRFDYDLVDMHSVAYNGINKLPYTKKYLLELLTSLDQTVENRGDNIYLAAVKPKQKKLAGFFKK